MFWLFLTANGDWMFPNLFSLMIFSRLDNDQKLGYPAPFLSCAASWLIYGEQAVPCASVSPIHQMPIPILVHGAFASCLDLAELGCTSWTWGSIIFSFVWTLRNRWSLPRKVCKQEPG